MKSTPAAPRRFTSIGVTTSITCFRCQPERSREFRAHLVVPLIAALKRPLVRLGDHTQHSCQRRLGLLRPFARQSRPMPFAPTSTTRALSSRRPAGSRDSVK